MLENASIGRWVIWLMAAGFLLAGCRRGVVEKSSTAMASGALVQRAYVWQRDWSRSVAQAVAEHGGAFDQLGVLAAQIEWQANGEPPKVVRPAIDWPALRAGGRPVSLVVRVQRAGDAGEMAGVLHELLLDRCHEARAAGVSVAELQIDYDCPQKSLAAYESWLKPLRHALRPHGVPLRITTLPSWLGEKNFASLIDGVDGYVLQVHSFDLTNQGKQPTVCDPALARQWVAQAAKLGRPFYVALPTYRCLAGYAPDGRCLGMAADAVAPAWPPGTRVLELASDADAMSALVAEWTARRPAVMEGIYWYRLPISGELRNWRWPTLAAVMAGRPLQSAWQVRVDGGNPADLVLVNAGEKDECVPQSVTVSCAEEVRIAASDALGGWSCQSLDGGVAFVSPRTVTPRLLPPHGTLPLGWIRYDQTSQTQNPFSYEIVR